MQMECHSSLDVDLNTGMVYFTDAIFVEGPRYVSPSMFFFFLSFEYGGAKYIDWDNLTNYQNHYQYICTPIYAANYGNNLYFDELGFGLVIVVLTYDMFTYS